MEPEEPRPSAETLEKARDLVKDFDWWTRGLLMPAERELLVSRIAAALRASEAAVEKLQRGLDVMTDLRNEARAEATKAAETVVLAVGLTIEQTEFNRSFKAGAAMAVEEIAYRLSHHDAPYPVASSPTPPTSPETEEPPCAHQPYCIEGVLAPVPSPEPPREEKP